MGNSYNMVAGYDPLLLYVIDMLGIELGDVPRFRDAYVSPSKRNDPSEDRLVIMTRTGRGAWWDGDESELDKIHDHPDFIEDVNDDFDHTFRHSFFRVPDRFTEPLQTLIAEAREAGWEFPTPMERFQQALDKLTNDKKGVTK